MIFDSESILTMNIVCIYEGRTQCECATFAFLSRRPLDVFTLTSDIPEIVKHIFENTRGAISMYA